MEYPHKGSLSIPSYVAFVKLPKIQMWLLKASFNEMAQLIAKNNLYFKYFTFWQNLL